VMSRCRDGGAFEPRRLQRIPGGEQRPRNAPPADATAAEATDTFLPPPPGSQASGWRCRTGPRGREKRVDRDGVLDLDERHAPHRGHRDFNATWPSPPDSPNPWAKLIPWSRCATHGPGDQVGARVGHRQVHFRCTYCMPAEGLQWLGRQEILSFEEISRLVGVLARLGVDEVRLTGGEPLVRATCRPWSGCSHRPRRPRSVIDDERRPARPGSPVRWSRPACSASTSRSTPSTRPLRRDHADGDASTRSCAASRKRSAIPSCGRSRSTASPSKVHRDRGSQRSLSSRGGKPYVVRFIEFMRSTPTSLARDDVLTGAGDPRDHRGRARPAGRAAAKASSTAPGFRFRRSRRARIRESGVRAVLLEHATAFGSPPTGSCALAFLNDGSGI